MLLLGFCTSPLTVFGQIDTRFSVDRGFYDTPFTVELASDPPGASIHYTLDGSAPSPATGTLYTEPLTISGTTLLRAVAYTNTDTSNVDTQTYLFPADIFSQPETTLDGAFWTEAMDASVLQAYSADELRRALTSIPSISLVLDNRDMFHPNGIHWSSNLEREEDFEIERPVSMEWIYPAETFPEAEYESFQVDAGLRIQGDGGRWFGGKHDSKQSFTVIFRREYDADVGRLNEPVFKTAPFHGDSEARDYDRIILRGGHNKAWSMYDYGDYDGIAYEHKYDVYTRDQWARDAQLSMSGYGARGAWTHLFINGKYWGLYNPTERPDHRFAASYFGGNSDDWFSYKKKGGAVSGDSTRYQALVETVSNSRDLDEVRRYLDVEGFIDFMILVWYSGVGDVQWYANNNNRPPGPLRFFAWDFEDIFIKLPNRSNDGAWAQAPGEDSWAIFRNLWDKNRDFRVAFSDRVYKHFFNDGVMTDDRALARWLALADVIEDPIILESARWGDERRTNPSQQFDETRPTYTREEHWYAARDFVSNLIRGNGERFLSVMQERRYFAGLHPPRFSQEGGPTPYNFSLTISNIVNANNGTIYYTLDGTDPRASGEGDPSANAQEGGDEVSVPIQGTVTVSARIYDEGIWSPLYRARYYRNLATLVINEIMYKPLPEGTEGTADFVDGSEFEFVEVKNYGDEPIELEGAAFVAGISYTFPPAQLLSRRQLVLARNAEAFERRYGFAPFGVYQQGLNNRGETLMLVDAGGTVIDEVTYADADPWPVAADTAGVSLELIDPKLDNTLPSSWRASIRQGGSPLRDNLATDSVDLVYFDAEQREAGRLELTWETESETNNAGFSVEMAREDGPFEEVGYVEGAGVSDEAQSYSYLISDLDLGLYRFRLKQIDLEGSFTYTPEVQIRLQLVDDQVFEAPFPNPFTNQASLRFVLREPQLVRADLFNALGQHVQVVYRGPVLASQWHTLHIDGSTLASGLYILRLTGDTFDRTEKLVLMR